MTTPILLIEDSENDIELVVEAFSRLNIDPSMLTILRDGAQALEFISHAQRTPDTGALPSLIVVDIKLPKVSGLEFLHALRSAGGLLAAIPVVMLTSSDEPQDVAEAYQYGASSYVRKPIAFDEFVTVVEQMGKMYGLLNRAPPGTVTLRDAGSR